MAAKVASVYSWNTTTGIPYPVPTNPPVTKKPDNLLKQAARDVQRFKSRVVAPEVLEGRKAKLAEEFLKEVDEVEKSESHKKWLKAQIALELRCAVETVIESKQFKAKLGRIAAKLIGEIDDTKQP